ncbi:MAG TPA: Ig-like domain-containing protein [Longimicrobium sp.]|nr:Ig-like domain-containing protein [Longimicrobium sp.]
MRLAAALAAAVVVLSACAQPQPPPGGPEDKEPPRLIATRPDTLARLGSWTGPAVFVFDEGLSEQGVEEAVTVSPAGGSVAVDKSGDEIRVQPRRGWLPGRVYQVELAPGIQDRFGNKRTEGTRLVFSTGPEIPDTRATGVVTERTTGQPVRDARVEAVLRPDSLVYAARTDSAGAFTLQQVPPGAYTLRAYRDANRNQALDPFEARDSTALEIAVGQAPRAELAVLMPDTTGPVLGSARPSGEWIELRFDDFLDPAQPLDPSQVAIAGADSVWVPVRALRIGPPPDTARADTAGGDTAGRPTVRRDTAASARGPLPSQLLLVQPGTPLAPETVYRVRVTGVRNLHGLQGGGEAPLRTAAPAAAPRPATPPPANPPAPTPPAAPPPTPAAGTTPADASPAS